MALSCSPVAPCLNGETFPAARVSVYYTDALLRPAASGHVRRYRAARPGPRRPGRRLMLEWHCHLDMSLGTDPGEAAEFSKPAVWSRASTTEHGLVETRLNGHPALDVGLNYPVHRSAECLACLDSAIVKPAPRSVLLDLAIRRFSSPVKVPPENWFMNRLRPSNSARIQAAIEEYDNGSSPKPCPMNRNAPSARSPQLMGCKVERVDLGLGQIVPHGNVSLWSCPRKPWERVNQVLFPRP